MTMTIIRITMIPRRTNRGTDEYATDDETGTQDARATC